MPSKLDPTSQLPDNIKDMMARRLSLLKPQQPSQATTCIKISSSRKVPLRGTGRLKQLLDLPLDVIFEIASSFEPKDLLSLCRVTKTFRTIFMSRHARFVWQRVLEAVPKLPPCPLDMTEPQYASLVFEQFCWVCGKIRANKVYYTLRIRLCSPCARKNIVGGYYTMSSIYSLLPRAVTTHEDQGQDVLSTETISQENRAWHKYLRSEVDLVLKQYCAISSETTAFKNFIMERQTMTTAIMQHGAALISWENWAEEERERMSYALIRRRRKQIQVKMRELGWEAKYYPSCDDDKDLQRWHSLIDLPKELTLNAWSAMHPKLEAIYERSKQRRTEMEKRHDMIELVHFTDSE